MNEPPVIQLRLCPLCGASCRTTDKQCWMCQSPIEANPYAVAQSPEVAASAPNTRYDAIFLVFLLVCVGLALLIGIGIAAEDPGGLIPYLIVVGPAFAVTGVRALWQLGSTGRTRPGKLLISLVVSFALTIGVLALLAVAAVILLFILCLQALSNV